MGESGQVVVVPGVASGDGGVKATFEERGLKFSKDNEILTGSYYSVILDDGTGGEILAEESSSRSSFIPTCRLDTQSIHIT